MSDVVAGIYCRMSVATVGDTVKVDHQEKLCREAAERLGWTVADVYPDNNRSAWKKNRKRPEWNRMLADIESGRINGVMVYHGDRLIRQPEDLTTLLKLADGRGIKLASPTGERDLGSPEDRFILYIEVAMAMRESDNTSRRRKGQYERWRREGKVRPGGRGGRAFGFETDGTVLGDDRCVIATRETTSEAAIVRELATRILGGESVRTLVRDLEARGWRTPAGNAFTVGTLRAMLTRPRYAGLMPDGVSKGAWDPIVDRETWEAVCAVLDTRAAGIAPTSSARKHLLSGIARCGMPGCGAPMQVGGHAGKHGYRCSKTKHMFRTAEHLDAYVSGAVTGYLNRDDWPEPQVADPDHAGEFAALATARAELEVLIADHESPNVRLLLMRLERLDARLAQLREKTGDGARLRLLGQYRGITDEQFAALPLSVRRALVSACLEITVLPSGKRGPGFHPEYVELKARGR